MSIDPRMAAALNAIYAAATDENLWPEVIRDLLNITESQAASFCVLDGSDLPRLPIFSYINVESRSVDESRFLNEYLEGGMVQQDPTVQFIVAHPHQHLFLDCEFISESEKNRHPYYDWHGRFSDTRHRMAGMISAGPQIQSGVTLHRTRQAGKFEADQIERFKFLLPHIERAVRIGFQLGTLGAFHRATLELFDSNSRAIVLLDRQGRVLFANRAALAIGSAQDGIRLSRERLSLQRSEDDRKLQQLIGEALAVPATPSSVMRVERPSNNHPYAILVSPLSESSSLMTTARPAVCVIISDPQRQNLLPEEAVCNLFGLTPAEARLAVRLARGDELRSAAAELNITYATARTQLGAIFRKTRTGRQGELIRLLLTAVPI